MNSKRLYFVLVALVSLLVLGLVGGAYGADVLLQHASDQLVADRTKKAVLLQQEDQLARAKEDIKKYQDLANVAKSVVPEDKDQAQAVREIVNIAKDNAITLGSITFPTSVLGGTGTTAGKAQLSQLTPVSGIAGVYNLEITVASDTNNPVPYTSFVRFLNALEHNRRTALVKSVTLQPNQKDRTTVSFTLILDEYIKP
ncbi:MAG TPA: hypothetical protein VHC98_01955 [Candidatus Saccharimonadales bacterium]|nr:hypothetical protein [Candidatus Saccharimonadales bacterium]